MMSRNVLITSVLLVVVYSFLFYVEDEVQKKNDVLHEVLDDLLRNEVRGKDGLQSTILQTSKKKITVYDFSQKLLEEIELVLSLKDKPVYKHTDYIVELFEKFDIDPTLLKKDLSLSIPKYQLYNTINTYLNNYYTTLEGNEAQYGNLKMRLKNRQNTYLVNEMHRLDFQFYENEIYGAGVKYHYGVDGEKKRIDKIPLILDHIPDDIKFSVSLEDLVTGELLTLNSKLLP